MVKRSLASRDTEKAGLRREKTSEAQSGAVKFDFKHKCLKVILLDL